MYTLYLSPVLCVSTSDCKTSAVSTVWVKKVPLLPKKLVVVIFFPCQPVYFTFSQLLPNHMPTCPPILNHLCEYFMVSLALVTPLILTIYVYYEMHETCFVKTKIASHNIKLNITVSICYANYQILFPALSTTGWPHACRLVARWCLSWIIKSSMISDYSNCRTSLNSEIAFGFSTNNTKTRCSAIAERPRCRVRYSFRQK